MQQIPLSASTKAPASNAKSLSGPSRTAAHVNPAEVVPTPVVRTERGQSAAAKRKICD